MLPFDLNSEFVDHILGFITVLQKHLLPALFDLLVGMLVIRIIVRITRSMLKLTHMQTGLRYVITSIVEILLWLLLSYVLLIELRLEGVIIFFTGSIAAIGIAMAVGGSTLISDIVAAVFLARDRDFNVGDEVIVGWDPATQGVIESMDARRIRLRDQDGRLHVIPNSVVERKEWVVVTRGGETTAFAKAAKTAKRIGVAALDKRTNLAAKARASRKNEQ
jgi:small-conductance mechanosensitive channel